MSFSYAKPSSGFILHSSKTQILSSLTGQECSDGRGSFVHCYILSTKSGEGDGTPLQYSCLENPTGGAAWWAAVYGVSQSRTRLKHLSSSRSKVLEKEMATHSSVLAWRIPGMGKPGGLRSVGSHRVRHN